MAGDTDVLIRFIGDTKQLRNDVDKVAGTGKTMKKWAIGVGAAVGGAFAVKKVADFGKASVDAALESQKATAGLENVFRKAGDATGTAAKAAEDYAGSLSRKIGVDDEAIMSGQTLLASFSNVSSEAARSAGVFDRATAAAADLSAAGFGDLIGNSKTLGVILQDPVKGMTKLKKAGVLLTDAQKEQIKAFVKSGNVLGAQNLILGQIEKKVGGTAEKTATGADKMKVAFNEAQESVGKALLPAIEKLTPLLGKAADFIQRNASVIVPLVIGLGSLAAVVKGVTFATKAWDAAQKIATAAQWLWNAAMSANPIGLVVVAIAALVAGVIIAYKKVGWFRAIVDTLWQALQAGFGWIKKNWPLLLAILTGPFGIAVLLITKNWGTIKAAIVGVWDWIKKNWPLLLAILTGPIGLAVLAIMRNWDTLKNAVTGLWQWIKDKVAGIAGFFTELPGKIGTVFKGLADLITAPFRAAFNSIASLWNTTVGSLSFKIPGWVPGIGGKGFDVPDIPTLMKGGTVLSTGLAVVHEGEQFSGVGNELGGNINHYTISVEVRPGTDPAETGRAIVDIIRAYERGERT